MKYWSILFLIGLAGSAAAATCAPPSLVHIVTTETTPGIDPQSFDAQPKSLFRQGAKHSRLEEQPDDRNKVHGLAVIDEPNIWMANLYDGTGRHIVDPGPALATKAAVFADDRISPRILDLEFGCEAAYIAANAPKVDRTETVDGVALDIHRVTDGTEAVEILVKPGAVTPSFARYYRSGKLVWAIRYDLYEVGVAEDPDMFTAPKGVKYVETQLKTDP
jgi:hypothetical protein